MHIEISKNCGLCGGCKRAIDKTIKALDENHSVVIFKPIVHNETVNKMLQDKGAVFKEKIADLKSNDTVIIRAHGEPKSVFDELNNKRINYIDCTCPNVKKIHEKVEFYSRNSYQIVIIGKENHPEVIGTVGYCMTQPIVINSVGGVHEINFSCIEKFYLICQTTFNIFNALEIYNELKQQCKENNIELIFDNTLCDAQRNINLSSMELAKKCDLMIVVGGENSSNSHELYENVKKITKTIFLNDIYKWKDILEKEKIVLNEDMKIGITAGASTMKKEIFELKNMIISQFRYPTGEIQKIWE